jgi:hypothetical protein
MTIRGLCALMVLSISAGTSVAFAEEARVDVGIANTGEQTFHGTVNIGRATPAEIEAIVAATLQKDSLNAQEAVEYKQEVAMLSAEIGVRKPAVENFLRILGEGFYRGTACQVVGNREAPPGNA